MSIEPDDLKVIYRNNKPYGIRNNGGYLLFFTDITKFEGQDERYAEEIKQQSALAEIILAAIREGERKSSEPVDFGYKNVIADFTYNYSSGFHAPRIVISFDECHASSELWKLRDELAKVLQSKQLYLSPQTPREKELLAEIERLKK